jgi:hypothetical protein
MPEKPEIFASEIGKYWFDDQGILISESSNVKRDMRNMPANIAMLKRITGGKPVCLIVHLTNSPRPDKETLAYVREEMPKVYKAMAMVTKSGVAKVIMALLFKFKPPPIPMKTFSNEDEARQWILQYR